MKDGLYEGNVLVEGTLTCATVTTSPLFVGNINVQSWKGFDIKHPSKEGHRLRYVCLEGPEAGVYFRGRVRNSDFTVDIITTSEIDFIVIDMEHIEALPGHGLSILMVRTIL